MMNEPPYLMGIIIPADCPQVQAASVCDIPEGERWTAIAALVTQADGPHVITASMPEGVLDMQLKAFCEWVQQDLKIWSFPFPALDVETLRGYVGTPYNVRHLVGFLNGREHDPPQPAHGVTCAELIALCDGGELCRFSGRPTWRVRPVDVQMWAMNQGCELLYVGR